jgi:predicted O-linked N-acetylglucosamine transferase (SPINDLY family)
LSLSPRNSTFELALSLLRAQDFAAAENCLLQVLQGQPGHVGALNVLALLLAQSGRPAQAERYFLEAIRVFPSSDATYHNYGLALKALERPAEALAMFNKSLTINPSSPDTLSNRGTLLLNGGNFQSAIVDFDKAIAMKSDLAEAWLGRGHALNQLKRHGDADIAFERAIALKQDFVDAWLGRGHVLSELGRHDDAIIAFNQAIGLKPDFAEARVRRGNVLNACRRFDEALADFELAIALKPDLAEAWLGCGLVFAQLKRYDEALARFNRAIELGPDLAEARIGPGNILLALDRPAEALEQFEQALAALPRSAKIHVAKANALRNLNRFEDALKSYERALEREPDQRDALVNRANMLAQFGRMNSAIAAYEHALATYPRDLALLTNRASVLSMTNRFDAAIRDYEQALRVAPNDVDALSGLVSALLQVCDWEGIERLLPQLYALIERGEAVPGLLLIRMFDDPPLHLKGARNYARAVIRRPLLEAARSRGPSDRIRIAYLSGDFRHHPVAYLLPGLIERHDRTCFDVTAISFGPDDGSDIRGRLVKAFNRFEDVAFKSDREVALQLRDLQIDIAVDMTGYTQYLRPSILACRPAPINVSFLGYPGTLGTDFVDYVLADKVVLPLDQQPYYTEKIVHLPDCFFLRDSAELAAGQARSRAQEGLPEQGFVFCCFNNSYKFTAPMFRTWMRLLADIEGSVLWLSSVDSQTVANLRNAAMALGVDPSRIVFAARVPSIADHLARHKLADLFLDTLPYNAHSTANDALWAGLPVLTCAGQAFAGRVAASMSHAAGLPELVTSTLEEYEALAKKLVGERTLLQEMRRKLEDNRQSAPLFDLDRCRRHIESAYTMMWQRWTRGEKPEAFSVPPIEQVMPG